MSQGPPRAPQPGASEVDVTTYCRPRPLAWRQVGEETVVLHLQRRVAFGLNRAAGQLLELLEVPRDLASLTQLLGAAAPPRAELESFLQQLIEHGLVEECVQEGSAQEGSVQKGSVQEGSAAAAGESPAPAAAPPAEESPRTTAAPEGLELPRILWSDRLEALVLQTSPPMEIGNIQCAQ
jgi:hypothetical protein